MIAISKILRKPLTSLCPVTLFTNNSFSFSTVRWNSPIRATISNPTLLALESCTSMTRLKEIQARMTRTGLASHVFPASRLLAFCALSEQGNMNHANLLFAQFPLPNTYMWNTMIKGSYKVEMPIRGFSLFSKMVEMAWEMDSRTYVYVLKTCEKLQGSLNGASVHCVIWKMGYDICVLVCNGLLHFYGDVGRMNLARKVFDEMLNKDVVSWTTMIHQYQQMGWCGEALRLYNAMLMSEIEPNDTTLISVVSACSKSGDGEMGKKVHEHIRISGCNASVKLMNAVVDMYVKCGLMEAAQEVFDGMMERDVFTWTSMVNGYAKIGSVELARKLFEEMTDKNIVSWNAMIAGYSQNGFPKEALELFSEMIEQGLVPTENTLVCVLSSCGQLGWVDFGQWVHSRFIEGNRSVIISNALIDMYAKGGGMEVAAQVFDDMRERNIATWNTMISAYAAHGEAGRAVEAFEEMKREGAAPDDITFVGVLCACSHGGMVAKGVEYFGLMKEYGIEPKEEHVSCMVDLLGRSGNVDDAYQLVTRGGGKAAWGALLHSASLHRTSQFTAIAPLNFIHILSQEPGNYLMLAASSANQRRWDDVVSIRALMRENNVKKCPGHSLILIQGTFHRFLSSDISHPQNYFLYAMLHQLYSLCLKTHL